MTLWKMIQDHTQYLLNKDHQHHRWQPKNSWTLFQDYQDAQDKQQMQYPLTPKSKWKMLTNYWNFQNRSVQTFGYVYLNTNGQNHGPIWKTQLSLLNEICTVILWQDYGDKSNSRKFYLNVFGKKFRIGNVYSLTEKKGLFLSVYVDEMKLAGKKQNINPTWKILMKDVDLGEPTSFLDHVYLGCTQRECKINKNIVDNYISMFESRISAWTIEKYQKQKPRRNLMPKRYPHGPMTWKVMPRNACKDIANWQIKRRNNFSKSRRHA